ncbi:MAG: energy-coupling factor ABC transporter substrate-binding protein [Methanobacterium sp.]|uniref:energy-coupling factor ABC transporter substrate-binding protein n=1 Tax=Methanobacterium sp. TaxID=2164 RepID=UPI003D64B439|nr:energy-coupling factor ABC transporter substrate-binding protein [Methanobacterium sp.]
MVDKKPIILLCLVAIIIAIPLIMFNGMGEDQGYFSGADSLAGPAIESTGYHPWFNSIWEPPSGEIESLLFALQAAIGSLIIGYVFGYYNGQAKERKRQEKELKEVNETISK